MKKRKKTNGDPVAEAAANMNRAEQKPETLSRLSRWLQSQWLRHYVMASALGSETDREQMIQIGAFIDALKEVRK